MKGKPTIASPCPSPRLWTVLSARSRDLRPPSLRLPQTWSSCWCLEATWICRKLLPSEKSLALSQMTEVLKSLSQTWRVQTNRVDIVHYVDCSSLSLNLRMCCAHSCFFPLFSWRLDRCVLKAALLWIVFSLP